MEYEEVGLDTPLEELGPNLLIDTDAGRTVVRQTGTRLRKLTAYLPDGRKETLVEVPFQRTLRQAAASATSARPLRAFQLRTGHVVAHYRPVRTALAFLPFAVAAAMAAAGLWVDSLGFLRVILLTLGLALLYVSADALNKSHRHRQWVLGQGKGKVAVEEVPLPELPEQVDVDDVKEEYGRLLSDIVYRIENPALFDPHEPTSKEFTLALLQWDNNDGVVGDDERRDLARRVRATFTAARANAERIGMRHLPEQYRDRAGTALKAARLATDKGATESERETALRRAVEILDELALYFLPTGADARKAITGGVPLALPGRRSS